MSPPIVTKINDAVARSVVGRYFRLHGCGHEKTRPNSRFMTEMRAGLATFFAMAYIISVNASILADSGGTCICSNKRDPLCYDDPNYNNCLTDIRRDFITGTAAIAALTSFCMGLFANMPIALAPGMGLNAYFSYTVVGFHGSGSVPYRFAVTAVFIEGFVFVALSVLGLRQWLARSIPASIKLAAGVGIGLYLALIGLTYSAGIGAITGSRSTPIEIAGCLQSQLVDGACPSPTKLRSPTLWIGIFCGGFLTAVLLTYKIKGSIIAGILLVSIISWPRNTSLTFFPHDKIGDRNFAFFKKIVEFHPIENTLLQQKWDLNGVSSELVLALMTFLYVDILDVTGTLYSMARYAGAIDPVTQDFEGSAIAYLVDALGISVGALFGLSPVTAFIESGAGISEGGKTGITAMVTGLCFFISLFFAPIFASIPPWATGCTLIMVGAMMARSARDINWSYFGDALPAFLTLAIMPFTYSIAYGLITGIVSYAVINSATYLLEVISGGRIKTPDRHMREPWSWRATGGILPNWLVRILRGQRDFWRDGPDPRFGYPTPPDSVLHHHHDESVVDVDSVPAPLQLQRHSRQPSVELDKLQPEEYVAEATTRAFTSIDSD